MLDYFAGIRSSADLKNAGSSGGLSEVSISKSGWMAISSQSVFDCFFEGFAFIIKCLSHRDNTDDFAVLALCERDHGTNRFKETDSDPSRLAIVESRIKSAQHRSFKQDRDVAEIQSVSLKILPSLRLLPFKIHAFVVTT